MNAAVKDLPLADLQAQFDQLKSELDRRTEAMRKAVWAREKAKECLERARELDGESTFGRMGKQLRNNKQANIARADARNWELKAQRFDKEAGIAQADTYVDPF